MLFLLVLVILDDELSIGRNLEIICCFTFGRLFWIRCLGRTKIWSQWRTLKIHSSWWIQTFSRITLLRSIVSKECLQIQQFQLCILELHFLPNIHRGKHLPTVAMTVSSAKRSWASSCSYGFSVSFFFLSLFGRKKVEIMYGAKLFCHQIFHDIVRIETVSA